MSTPAESLASSPAASEHADSGCCSESVTIFNTDAVFGDVERYEHVVAFINLVSRRLDANPIKYRGHAVRIGFAIDHLDGMDRRAADLAQAEGQFDTVADVYAWLRAEYAVPEEAQHRVVLNKLAEFTDPVSVNVLVSKMRHLLVLNRTTEANVSDEKFVNKIMSFFADTKWEVRLTGIRPASVLLDECTNLGASLSFRTTVAKGVKPAGSTDAGGNSNRLSKKARQNRNRNQRDRGSQGSFVRNPPQSQHQWTAGFSDRDKTPRPPIRMANMSFNPESASWTPVAQDVEGVYDSGKV